ncbi:MAG: putative bifunctional diguanylate cyclase/phosphodiesterase [Lachnotalea sp.]
MNNKKVPGKLKLKMYIVVLIISSIVIIFMGNTIHYFVHNFYDSQMEKESQRIAKNYASSLSQAINASEIINTLIDDKINAVTQMVGKLDEPLNNDVLKKIADSLFVDEIYSYNKKGSIVYSATGKYIGWTAYKGHSVFDFIRSGKESYIEEIRRDSASDVFYKYAYFRRKDGTIVQIGIQADKIKEFLGTFEMDYLLKEMVNDQNIEAAYFIDNDYQVIAGEEYDNTEFSVISSEEKKAILSNKIYTKKINLDQKVIYQMMIPVELNDKKIGTLVLAQCRTAMDRLMNEINIITYFSLFMIVILIILLIVLSYKRNNKIIYEAYHNQLTKLANKRYYDEYVHNELKKKTTKTSALMVVNYINLDFINFVYGYYDTENIIKKTAITIEELCSLDHYLFHISYDRFAIYVENYKDKDELQGLSNSILKILKENAISNHIGGSIGIYEIDKFEEGSNELLKYATLAANNNYTKERFGFYFYNNNMQKILQWDESIESELKRIIYQQPESDEFYLEFQPIVDLKTNKIAGFEALARLKTDKLGSVSPIEFINIAEKTQLIIPLGERILQLACDFLKQIEEIGYEDICVAVNVSGVQLLNEDFIPNFMEIIKNSKINPSNLEIELTESVFSDDVEYVNEKISRLKADKIGISIDDFGTGYSSFARESDLDITTLKIDKFFIDQLLVKDIEKVVTADIITMAHRRGHLVVAEGVEYEEQREYLLNNKCDYIQGYVFSRPLSAKAAIDKLQSHNEANWE